MNSYPICDSSLQRSTQRSGFAPLQSNVACKQALLCGRENARASGEAARVSSRVPLARLLFTISPNGDGELARRLRATSRGLHQENKTYYVRQGYRTHTFMGFNMNPRVVDIFLVNTIFQKNLVGPSCFISTAKFALEIKKKSYNFFIILSVQF